MSDTSRKRLRLAGYDYTTNGVYFLTICTREKKKLLCDVKEAPLANEAPIVTLTELGRIVKQATEKIPGIDKYVIMPNHVHMILFLRENRSISTIIRLWKSVIAAKYGNEIWQKSYYDHIIRDEADYKIKWKYIDDNPSKWASDEYYLSNK